MYIKEFLLHAVTMHDSNIWKKNQTDSRLMHSAKVELKVSYAAVIDKVRLHPQLGWRPKNGSILIYVCVYVPSGMMAPCRLTHLLRCRESLASIAAKLVNCETTAVKTSSRLDAN